MGYTITALRNDTRLSARNALQSVEYPDYQIDRALQKSSARLIRGTKGTAKLDTLAMTIGSNILPAFPTNFEARLLIDAYLTISGQLIEPGITITTIESVLQAQRQNWPWCIPYGYLSPQPQTSPPTGQPRLIGFSTQTSAITDFLADLAYVVNLWWYPPFTSWLAGTQGAYSASPAYQVGDIVSSAGTLYQAIAASTNQAPPNAAYWLSLGAGTNDNPVTLTTNLSDEQLDVVTTWGAPAFLQFTEAVKGKAAPGLLATFDAEIKRLAGLGVATRGNRVLIKNIPTDFYGGWWQCRGCI